MSVMLRVFCNVLAYVSCRGYVSIPLKVHGFAVNQGGTANDYSSLAELSVKDFFISGGFFMALLTKRWCV